MTDVLIVGAGPTGLALACELRRHGVAVRLIDQRGVHVDRSRAVDVQSRTLEVFHDMGVASAFLRRGKRITGLGIYDSPRRIARVEYKTTNAPFPFILAIPQTDTEAILEQHLDALGGRVERGVRFRTLESSPDGVRALLSDKSGNESVVEARWVVGCDGAGSIVRFEANIEFEPTGVARRFVSADATMDWALPEDELALFMADDAFVLVLPLPGERRVRLLADINEDDPKPDSLEAFGELATSRMRSPVMLRQPGYVSTYHVRRHIAKSFRAGRVLLAGDAAHTYDPVGGHGMNQGIQDAYNLGWKLAMIVRGCANEELIHTYESERRAAATNFARDMDFGARLLMSRQKVPASDHERLMSFAVKSSSLRRSLLDSTLEKMSTYDRNKFISDSLGPNEEQSGGAPAGSRAPNITLDETRGSLYELMRGTQFTVLLFAGSEHEGSDDLRGHAVVELADDLQRRWSKLLRVWIVVEQEQDSTWSSNTIADRTGEFHRRYGASSPSAYVIRPDGHVGLRSIPADGMTVRRYLCRLLGEPGPAGLLY